MTAERLCPECHRTLPADAEHFYAQRGRSAWSLRCRECLKADGRKRRAAERERRAAEPPRLKHCIGGCDRELPAVAEHFPLDTVGRVSPRCHDCAAARPARKAAPPADRVETVEPPTRWCRGCDQLLPAVHFRRRDIRPYCHECSVAVESLLAADAEAELAKAERKAERAAELEHWRLNFIRASVEAAPSGGKAAAGAEARAMLRRADVQTDRIIHTTPPGIRALLEALPDAQGLDDSWPPST